LSKTGFREWRTTQGHECRANARDGEITTNSDSTESASLRISGAKSSCTFDCTSKFSGACTPNLRKIFFGLNWVTSDEGTGPEDDVVDIFNVSSGSEGAIGAGVAKSFMGGEIGVTLRWAVWGLGPGLLVSNVVEVSVVTGGRYMLSKDVGLVSRVVLAGSFSSSSSGSEERPPSSSYWIATGSPKRELTAPTPPVYKRKQAVH